jgi:predicted RNA-binding protein YlxR (DUF448 family)
LRRGHVPVRTCIGCLSRQPKCAMLRIVMGEHGLRIGDWPGRGAYLCRDVACLENAIKRKAFGKHLGSQVGDKDLAELRRTILGQNCLDVGCGEGVICFSSIGGGTLV